MKYLLLFVLLICTPALAADLEFPREAPSVRTLEYDELWRTDPDSDEYLLGLVQSFAIDEDGNIYMLDSQLQEVHKFDSAGDYAGIIAHQGEGPGEIGQAWRVEYWSPGEILIPRMFQPKITRVDTDGMPLDNLRVFRHVDDESETAVSQIRPFGERAVVEGSIFEFSAENARSVNWIGVIDRTGVVVKELDSKESPLSTNPMNQVYDEAKEFWSWQRWTASNDGRIYRAPSREEWLIEQYDADGKLVNTIRRDIQPRARTKDEFERMKNSRNFIFNGKKVDIEFKLLETEPPIQNLVIIGDRLWAFHNPVGDDLPEGIWRKASVHTLDGELIEDLDLAVPHDSDLDLVNLLLDGRVVVIENGRPAMQANLASFGAEMDEESADADPAVVVVYAPRP